MRDVGNKGQVSVTLRWLEQSGLIEGTRARTLMLSNAE